jgi:hypothetical protein
MPLRFDPQTGKPLAAAGGFDPQTGQPIAAAATVTLAVTCPPGAAEGTMLHVPHGGQEYELHVPPGVAPGQTFQVSHAACKSFPRHSLKRAALSY